MSETGSLGLRERKRAETRSHLERAAVEITLRDGIEGATIDAISAAADVSPRTFFNYFDTKEDAILGLRDPKISDELVAESAARREGLPALDAVIGMLFDVFESSPPDLSLQRARHEIIHAHPQLMARQLVQLTRMAEELVAAIGAVLPAEDHAVRETVFGLCGGAFRVAVKEWMASGSGELDRERLERRAIELARKAVGTLA